MRPIVLVLPTVVEDGTGASDHARVQALVDRGATVVVVTGTVAADLPVEVVPVSGVGTPAALDPSRFAGRGWSTATRPATRAAHLRRRDVGHDAPGRNDDRSDSPDETDDAVDPDRRGHRPAHLARSPRDGPAPRTRDDAPGTDRASTDSASTASASTGNTGTESTANTGGDSTSSDSTGNTGTESPSSDSTSGDSARTVGAALEHLVARLPGAVVLLRDDVDDLPATSAVARRLEVPLLWWGTRTPVGALVPHLARSVDGILAPHPIRSDAAGTIPSWPVGHGLDTTEVEVVEPAPRPPLRLLLVGRDDPLTVLPDVLRAVAGARARGVDARLTVVEGGAAPLGPADRQELDELAADLALADAVELPEPSQVADLQRWALTAHALIDTGTDGDVDPRLLAAMARGRPVLSCDPELADLVAGPVPLRYRAGDAATLADAIVGLGNAWRIELQELAARLHERVEEQHGVAVWADRVLAAVAGASRRSEQPAAAALPTIDPAPIPPDEVPPNRSGAATRPRRRRILTTLLMVVVAVAAAAVVVLL